MHNSEANTATEIPGAAGLVPAIETVTDSDGNNNIHDNNNKSTMDIQLARQTKLSSLKTLDFTDKSSSTPRKMIGDPPVSDSTVVAEFQRLRRLRRRHSESNLLRNDGSGLPGIASKAPHRHGLSSSLNSSGSTTSMNSSPGASNSDGDAVLDLFLSPMSPKTSELQRTLTDKSSPSSCSSPRTPRPLSPVVIQRVTPTSPRDLSPLSPRSGSVASPLVSPVSPKTPQPKSPSCRRKPSPLTIEDTPRPSLAHLGRPLAPVPLRPPDINSPRTYLPDADSPKSPGPNSPKRTSTDQQLQQDLEISPRNQHRRVNSGHGSKHFETTLQDIAEHRERNGENIRKTRLAQHPKKMLVRRNSEPPNGMARRLRMAGLANEETKRTPQGRITQEILSQKQGSEESICSSICEDKELKEKCMSWLETVENP